MHLLSLLFAGTAALAPLQDAALDGGAPSDTGAVYRGQARQLDVTPPRVDAPDMRIDGALDEPHWQRAARLTAFTQYEPVEGVPAVDDTEVYVFYSADALYVGVRAHDSRPDEMRAKLGERDRAMMTDDWVRIMLDTFNDRRQAYIFYLTPLGIQSDGLWIEGRVSQGPIPVDFNPDYIWESESRLTGAGWTAEFRIPYISLRFREDAVQDWGFNVARETRRNGYKSSWAPLTQNQTSTLAQIGRLRGLQGLRPKRLVEVNPVATARRTGEIVNNRWQRQGVEPELGGNARVGITQNLVLDATLNPDFSQVEADAEQITANERFALSLPEKRAFFLEGTEIFQTPQRLVYTRTIIDPAGGAKLTGKLGAFNVGYLGAIDESGAGDQAVNLLRVRRDVGTGSTIGALLTDRSVLAHDAANRVIGADARLLFRQRYVLTAQYARSWTSDSGGTQRDGDLLYVSLQRSGRTVGWQLLVEDVAPSFHASNGFINRTGDTRLFGSTNVTFYRPAGSVLERWGADLRIEGFHPHAEFRAGTLAAREAEIELQPNIYVRGGNIIRFIVRRGYYAFDPADFTHYGTRNTAGEFVTMSSPRELDGLWGFALMPHLRPSARLQIGGRMYLREVPIYVEGSRGFEFLAAPDIKVWPTDGLSLEFTYARSRLWRHGDDVLFSTQDIPRVRAQYQFSRALLARAVGQYNLQRREPLHDPATGLPLHTQMGAVQRSERGQFGGQLLVSYQPSPGTLFYIGWSQQLRGPSTYRLDELERTSDGVFVKFSYLYRL